MCGMAMSFTPTRADHGTPTAAPTRQARPGHPDAADRVLARQVLSRAEVGDHDDLMALLVHEVWQRA